MDRKPKVCLSGFVLSSLLFDCMNSQDDQEGFLIGTMAKKIKREINDHQSMYTTQEELVISIYSSVPCGGTQSFYNSSGHIRMADIESCLGDRKSAVVGWYRFRRHSPIYPSLYESLVHRELRKLFSSNFSAEDDCLLFGILTSSNISFATHSFDYAFFAEDFQSSRSFKNLSVSLLNLGDTKGQYRINSDASAYMESASFDSVLSHSWDFNSSWQTEDQILEFHKRLREKLDNLQEEMTLSDAYNASLEHEVNELNCKMQHMLSALELPSSHCNPDEQSASSESEVKCVEEAQKPQFQAATSSSDESVLDINPHKKNQYFVNELEQPVITSVKSKVSRGIPTLEENAAIFEMTFLAGLSKSEIAHLQKEGKSPKLAYIEAVTNLGTSERTTQAVLSKLQDILTPCESVKISKVPSTDVKLDNLKRNTDVPSSSNVVDEKFNVNPNISLSHNTKNVNVEKRLELTQNVIASSLVYDTSNVEEQTIKEKNSDVLLNKTVDDKKESPQGIEIQTVLVQDNKIQGGQVAGNQSIKCELLKDVNFGVLYDLAKASASSEVPCRIPENPCISNLSNSKTVQFSGNQVKSTTDETPFSLSKCDPKAKNTEGKSELLEAPLSLKPHAETTSHFQEHSEKLNVSPNPPKELGNVANNKQDKPSGKEDKDNEQIA